MAKNNKGKAKELERIKSYRVVCETRVQAEILADFLKEVMLSNKNVGFQIKGRWVLIEVFKGE